MFAEIFAAYLGRTEKLNTKLLNYKHLKIPLPQMRHRNDI